MKKILALMLALILCLLLCACGAPEEAPTQGNNQEGFVDMTDEEALAKLWVGSFASEDGEHTLDIRDNGSCTLDGVKYTWISRVLDDLRIVLDIYDGNTALWGAGPYDAQQILSLSLYEGPSQETLPDLSAEGIITLTDVGKCEKIELTEDNFYDYFYFTTVPYYQTKASGDRILTRFSTYLKMDSYYQKRLVASDVTLVANYLEQDALVTLTADFMVDELVQAEGEVRTQQLSWDGPWEQQDQGILLATTNESPDVNGQLWIKSLSNLTVEQLSGYLWIEKE